MVTLTKEQRELVEDNHNLIYGFAHENKLNIEEYYDILAISLCKAAAYYNKNKGAFSTLVYKIMKNDIKLYMQQCERQKRIPNDLLCSYYDTTHYAADHGMESTILDTLSSKEPDFSFYIQYDEFLSGLKYPDRNIVELLMDNERKGEIMNTLGITRSQYNMAIKRIRKKAERFI